ncbi:thiamine phosphate synthase [Aquimarina sp. AU474]|uniref:thiamine phosphate synthase n=1 Tax=Aquimarina sp. AU474 TaxID=2108529 RepID=UPI000D68ED6E|nr:thiamine phosphate synthase [Aquimarina sp. AU474]
MKEIQLQYISQGTTPQEHLVHIEKVCSAGGRWIQLRLKNTDVVTYLDTALKCRNICDQYNAIMIVNDNIDVAKAVLADGVHLGLNDTNIIKARKILGDNFIIGGTANTIDDCKQHVESGVDYIGLGPYRYTTTKNKLSPILGINGYKSILSEFRNFNTTIPVVAIGGIIEKDIKDLIAIGLSGIAVSGMLTKHKDLKEKIENIKTHIV